MPRSAYTKSQSAAVALWVLALQNKRTDAEFESKGQAAPEIIATLVNALGPHHSPYSIVLHTHGYDRLLLGRRIGRGISNLQREVAQDLKLQGVVSTVYGE